MIHFRTIDRHYILYYLTVGTVCAHLAVKFSWLNSTLACLYRVIQSSANTVADRDSWPLWTGMVEWNLSHGDAGVCYFTSEQRWDYRWVCMLIATYTYRDNPPRGFNDLTETFGDLKVLCKCGICRWVWLSNWCNCTCSRGEGRGGCILLQVSWAS